MLGGGSPWGSGPPPPGEAHCCGRRDCGRDLLGIREAAGHPFMMCCSCGTGWHSLSYYLNLCAWYKVSYCLWLALSCVLMCRVFCNGHQACHLYTHTVYHVMVFHCAILYHMHHNYHTITFITSHFMHCLALAYALPCQALHHRVVIPGGFLQHLITFTTTFTIPFR